MSQYRKAIGAVALAAAEIIAVWTGAPPWLLTAIPVLYAVATWGVPNAPTARQIAQILGEPAEEG